MVEYRWAEGLYEGFPALIAELIAARVELHRDRRHAGHSCRQERDYVHPTGDDCGGRSDQYRHRA